MAGLCCPWPTTLRSTGWILMLKFAGQYVALLTCAQACWTISVLCLILQENYLTNPVSGEEGDRPSPYADGMFQVRLQLSSNYPNTAPKVRIWAAAADNFCFRSGATLQQMAASGPHKFTSNIFTVQIVFKTRVFHPAIDAKEGKVSFVCSEPTQNLFDTISCSH